MPNSANKVLLVFPGPPATSIQSRLLVNLPLSVLQLAAYLLERGYDPVIYDTRIQSFDEVEEIIPQCLAVGISSMTGLQIRHGLACAARIRERNPRVPFIWGGVHPTLFPEQTMQHALVDFVVMGEGEESLFELLEYVRTASGEPSSIKGIAYRDKEQGRIYRNVARPFLDMETLPLAAYHLVDVGRYPNILNAFDYQSSRGCPYRCGFCYNIAFNNRSYRTKSAHKVVAELKSLAATYHVGTFSFNDDEFFINRQRVEEICDLVIESECGFQWNASCRLNIIRKYTDDQMRKLRESGCRKLNFGAESGSPRILELIQKDISIEDIFEGTRHCIKNKIIPVLSFVAGFPGETFRDSLMTKDLISQAWRIDSSAVANGVFIYNPYPGTALFQEAVRLGARFPASLEEWGNWTYKYEADLPWLTAKHRRLLRVMFLIVRLDFYLKEIRDRPGFNKVAASVAHMAMLPWVLSGWIRWKWNFFAFPVEWYLWAFLMNRIWGFI